MLRGLYTAATAMMAYSRRMDVVTNNLVNVETAGFKQDTMTTRSFPDVLLSRLKDPSIYQYKQVGPHNYGMHVDQVYTSFATGPFEETGAPADMALVGDGFFVVQHIRKSDAQDEDSDVDTTEKYTRAGNFGVDADGYLVTPNGCYVQGQNGDILVGGSDFTVDESGAIYSADGEYVDTLRVVRFEDNSVLRKYGDNLYTIFEYPDADYPDDPMYNERGAEPIDMENFQVKQGFLEASNVNEAREMVRMMETQRAYEVNQRMITMFDDSLRLSVNEIAKF